MEEDVYELLRNKCQRLRCSYQQGEHFKLKATPLPSELVAARVPSLGTNQQRFLYRIVQHTCADLDKQV